MKLDWKIVQNQPFIPEKIVTFSGEVTITDAMRMTREEVTFLSRVDMKSYADFFAALAIVAKYSDKEEKKVDIPYRVDRLSPISYMWHWLRSKYPSLRSSETIYYEHICGNYLDRAETIYYNDKMEKIHTDEGVYE